MTDRLDEKIRAFVAELVNDPPATPEIEFEGVESPGVAALRPVPNRRRWVPAVVAVSAAFAVLIAVGLPVLFFGGGDSVVVGEPATTAASIVTTVPATTLPATTVPATIVPPVVPATPMVWERLDDPVVFGGEGEQRMTDVAAGEGVAVAVGLDRAGGDSDAAVWYSLDGTTWNRVPHDEAVFGGDGHQQMNAVVAVESGFVAVGSEGTERDPLGLSGVYAYLASFETHAAVWRSDDGIRWERVPHVDAFSEALTGLVMNDVTFDGSGLVVVGGAFHRTAPFATWRWGASEPGEPAPPHDVDIDVDAAVWRSNDGIAWRRVAVGDEAMGGDTVPQRMNAVVAGGPGFVAVGQEGFDFLGVDEWTPGDAPGDVLTHVTENVAAVWTSPDGETWTRVESQPSLEHPGGAVTGWSRMFDVTAQGSSLVAVGRDFWDPPGGMPEGAAVWLSPDGLSWQRVIPEDAYAWPDMQAVATSPGERLVAVGGWSNYLKAGAWSSTDNGNTWIRHPHDDALFGGAPSSPSDAQLFGAASIQGAASYADTVIAVGMMKKDAAVWVGSWGAADG